MQAKEPTVIGPDDYCAELITSARYDELPAAVLGRVIEQTIDTLGCAVGGSATPVAQSARRAASEIGGNGPASIIGTSETSTAAAAALANATAAHALELDDTDAASFCHIGAVVVPAAMSVAQQLNRSGHELVKAVALGYDVAGRIARWANPEHRLRGFHTTATATTFGAAAAAARLHGVDVTYARAILGVAASFVGGTFAFMPEGANIKRVHAGKAAMSGVVASALAIEGVDGPAGAIGGEFGFLRLFAGREPGDVDEELDTFVVDEVGVKPYPCCRFCHASIDAAIALFETYGPAREGDVVSVRVEVSALCAEQTGNRRPINELQRQFSTPYGVALGLLRGQVGLADYRGRPDSEALFLAEAIDIVVDPQLAVDDRRSAVIATTRSGTERRAVVRCPRGEPENPLRSADLRTKFDDLTCSVLGSARSSELYACLKALPDADDLSDLARLLAAI